MSSKWAKKEISAILHLPLWERLTHINARRTLIALVVGFILMLIGAFTLSIREKIGEYGVPQLFVDAFGGLIHAIGAVPVLRHLNPLWILLLGTAEEV